MDDTDSLPPVRAYIAGPMSGYPEHNFPAFRAAAASLRDLGFDVVSPHELDEESAGGPIVTVDEQGYRRLLGRDLAVVATVDVVAVLPGWERSRGARLEVSAASYLGIRVRRYAGGRLGSRVAMGAGGSPLFEPPPALRHPTFGLVGYAGAGKDSFAEALTGFGFTRVAFADPLREMLAALDPIVDDHTGERVSDTLGLFGGWDEAKRSVGELRALLQRLGTEAGRQVLGDDVWVREGMRRAKAACGPVVFTDVRFPNEAQAIKGGGGIIVSIRRPGFGPVNGHVSERLAGDTSAPDVVVSNDGTLDDLRAAASKVACAHLSPPARGGGAPHPA